MNVNKNFNFKNVDFSAVKSKLSMFSRVSVDAIEINQYGEKVTLTKLHCICEFLDSLGICFIPSSETEISMNFVDFNLFYLNFCSTTLFMGASSLLDCRAEVDSHGDSMDLCDDPLDDFHITVGSNDCSINPNFIDVEYFVISDSGIENTALTYNIQRVSHMGKYVEIPLLIDDIQRGSYDSILNVSTKGNISVSPLRLAINTGDIGLIRCLVHRLKFRDIFGQALNLIDHLGNNVFHVAFDTSDHDIINFFLGEVKLLGVDVEMLLQQKNMKDVSPVDVLLLYSMIRYKDESFDEMESTAVLGAGAFCHIDCFFGKKKLMEDKKKMNSVLFKDIKLSFKDIFDIDAKGGEPHEMLRFYRDVRGVNFNIPFLHEQQVELLGIDGNYYSRYRFTNLEMVPKKFSSDNVLRLRACLETYF